MHRFLLATIATICCAAPVAGQQPAIDTLALRAHTRFLASDALEGRGTGTRGERVAAEYIASVLQHLGLRGAAPAGDYLLPVPLRAARVDTSTAITLTVGAEHLRFAHDADFVLNTGGPAAFRDFAGSVVIAGPPADAAATLRNVDLRGRVVAVFGPLGAYALDLVPAWSRAGVTGVMLLVPDAAQFELYVRSRGGTRYFAAADVADPVWQPSLPVVIAGPRLSAQLLADSVQFDGTAIELPLRVDANIDVSERALPAANVGGILRGSDPARRGEYVVYTAHYDHLGISVPDVTGDSIYNGFSDNAAGVAMLLAVAASMQQQPPARSVLFLFLTGEERGLLGSSYFAQAPTIPLDSVRALINLDAGAPPAPPVNWRIAGGADNPLGTLADSVAHDHGWSVQLGAATPNSDYWPFLQRGVPAIFIIPGDIWENVSPEEREQLRARWDRYHHPADEYHSDFPFAGLARYAEFARLIGLRAANAP
jgi:hypothetical protein